MFEQDIDPAQVFRLLTCVQNKNKRTAGYLVDLNGATQSSHRKPSQSRNQVEDHVADDNAQWPFAQSTEAVDLVKAIAPGIQGCGATMKRSALTAFPYLSFVPRG